MRYYQYLNERLLHGEFKFGFELEGIFTTDKSYSYFYNSPWNTGELDDDKSIRTNDIGQSFEYKSPVLTFNLQNIQHTLKLLDTLFKDNEVITNKSCGFHVHLSFPYINPVNSFWILCHLANDNNMIQKFTKFNEFEFIHQRQANLKKINNISMLLKYKQYDELSNEFDEDKFTFLRLHPQGTLEWRGPRDFLNNYNYKIVVEFFKLTWDFISFIIKSLETKNINDLTYDIFKSYINKDMLKKYINVDTLDNKARYKIQKDNFIWYDGIFHGGIWNKGTWKNGTWIKGTWKKGVWYNGIWKHGIWLGGEWYNGIWENGVWENGRWYDGEWRNGKWTMGLIYSKKFKQKILSRINPKEFYNIEQSCKDVKELKEKVK